MANVTREVFRVTNETGSDLPLLDNVSVASGDYKDVEGVIALQKYSLSPTIKTLMEEGSISIERYLDGVSTGELDSDTILPSRGDSGGSFSGSLTSLLTLSLSGLASTSTDGLLLTNPTAATLGTTVQMSPRLHLRGHAWKTSGTSESHDWKIELLPVSGSTTTSRILFGWSRASASYTNVATLFSTGALSLTGTLSASTLIASTAVISGNFSSSQISDDVNAGTVYLNAPVECVDGLSCIDLAATGVGAIGYTGVADFYVIRADGPQQMLGFFGTTGTTQQADISDAAANTASNTAAINSVIAVLRNYGLIAS